MGTTLELLVIAGGELLLAHVGDSRTYLARDGAIAQLTRDHTVAEAMRSALSSAVGVIAAPLVDQHDLALAPGDRVLLATDGRRSRRAVGRAR